MNSIKNGNTSGANFDAPVSSHHHFIDKLCIFWQFRRRNNSGFMTKGSILDIASEVSFMYGYRCASIGGTMASDMSFTRFISIHYLD